MCDVWLGGVVGCMIGVGVACVMVSVNMSSSVSLDCG